MKIYIFVLVCLFPSASLRADLGGCLVYHANFVLKNGQTIAAYLPMSGYNDYAYLDDATQANAYCNDKAFQELINRVFWKEQKTLTVQVFKHIYLVQKNLARNRDGYTNSTAIAFTDSASVLPLHLDSIRYTVFLDAKNAGWSYPETGIEVVDARTCNMMMGKSVVNFGALSHASIPEGPESRFSHEFDYFLALNYNEALNIQDLESELKKVEELFYRYEVQRVGLTDKTKVRQLYEKQNAARDGIKRALWKKGIVLVFIQSTC